MKSAKSRLIAAAVLCATVGAVIVVMGVISRNTPPDTAASPEALSSGKREKPDVYLQSLDIQVEVTGNVAATRYTMVFKNRTDRILEGTLTFPLPYGRSVTHYTLDIDGKTRDGVPVENAKGTRAFEEIMRRRVDPGLLERVDGSNFRTRVYPVPAYGSRTISIGYEEELTPENGLLYYRMLTPYPDSLEKFTLKATVLKSGQKPTVLESGDEIRFKAAGGGYAASLARKKYRPARELIFALPAPAADTPQVLTQSVKERNYFLASVTPKMEARKKQWDDDLAIIWDVSLSGLQRNLKREIDILDMIFTEKKNANVHLYFLNNKNIKQGEYKVTNGNWDELKDTLKAAIFDGGTDFSQININDIAGNEILFFSDGISTLSDADFLNNAKTDRPIHCIVSSEKADYGVMKSIADAARGKFVNINALFPETLKKELLYETPRFLGTEHGNNVREVYQGVVTPVYGNFSIAGISDTGETELTLLFGFGDTVEQRIKVRLDAKNAAAQGNIRKIWAQKKAAELDMNYEKNSAEIAGLGQQFGIVTRNTSLIVLETINDYVHYGIRPPESEPELFAKYWTRIGEDDSPFLGEARSNSASRLNQGGNNTEARVTRQGNPGIVRRNRVRIRPDFFEKLPEERKSKGPPVSPDFLRKKGALTGGRSRENIQNGVIWKADALRYAYNQRSVDVPDIEGTITVKFTVEEFGWVRSAQVVKSTMNDRELEDRVIEIIKSWNFGKIDKPGDTTEVTYPFVFKDPAWTREYPFGSTPVDLSLDGAAAAAENLQRWWNIDYAALAKRKRPAPNDSGTGDDMFSEKGSFAISGIAGLNKTGIAKPYYMKTLTGKIDDDYQIYLNLRDGYVDSPVYYFYMADWFFTQGDRETALRILTSIADFADSESEGALSYRLLGYRFKEYGEYALEKFVCKKVIERRPTEPQSYRDYALALADNGEAQAALDSLYSLLTKSYSDVNIRFNADGIVEVAVAEINHLIAKNPRLNISKIDKRLIVSTPVDIRVVINGNIDVAHIDLHVLDPNGEECSYIHRKTRAGGRITAGFTSGYGPKQFLLKKAVKGKYRVYVSRFTSVEPLTVMVEIYTKYAGKTEQRRVVSFQMPGAGKKRVMVEAVEFDF